MSDVIYHQLVCPDCQLSQVSIEKDNINIFSLCHCDEDAKCKICKNYATQRIKSKYLCKKHGQPEAHYFPDITDIRNVHTPLREVPGEELPNAESLSGIHLLDWYFHKPRHKTWSTWKFEILNEIECNELEVECLDCNFICLINERDVEIDNDRQFIWTVCPKRKCKSERFKYV